MVRAESEPSAFFGPHGGSRGERRRVKTPFGLFDAANGRVGTASSAERSRTSGHMDNRQRTAVERPDSFWYALVLPYTLSSSDGTAICTVYD
ncbi:MAG: hypothetical protein AAGU32_02345 [Bacillota bacterium]